MDIRLENIDKGKAFDWGKTSEDYAKFRDIYPDEFYRYIIDMGLCVKGQKVLDLGTGTGVLPRNMNRFGAEWTGSDISAEQIKQAELLSQGMDIKYIAASAEDMDFPDESFDVITACQCYWYFDHERIAPVLARMLKKGGSFLMLMMNWLPYEDEIAGASEELVLKYSPEWSGGGERVHPISVPEAYSPYFEIAHTAEILLDVPFTREKWNGRMKACRGIGASLPPEKIAEWEKEHMAMLREKAPEKFTVKHFAAVAQLRKKQC